MSGCYSGEVTVISRDVTASEHRYCLSLVMHEVRIQNEEPVVREVFTWNLMLSWHLPSLTVSVTLLDADAR